MAFGADKEGPAMHREHRRERLPTLDSARQLGLDALLFLVQDQARIAAFLGTSGMDATTLRERAREDGTMVAVIEYLLANESLLLVFAAHGSYRPDDVQPALERIQRDGDLG